VPMPLAMEANIATKGKWFSNRMDSPIHGIRKRTFSSFR
jgi:hypothetical protein